MAKPMKIREFSTRPVWQEDAWLTQHAGQTLGVKKDGAEDGGEGQKDANDSEAAPQTVKNLLSNSDKKRLLILVWI